MHERNVNLQFHPQLPLGPNGQQGRDVRHTFQARKTYCILTAQWSCGEVVGWGKCYESESETQVLNFMNEVWPEEAEDQRPDFIAYDSACRLLRHLLVHHFNTSWIRRTRLIVDAFHYINHSLTDRLCRFRCNPAPQDDSQPDLIIRDPISGRASRAYNTETAEQLNSWLNGFESQTAQMTDYNFDFFITCVLMLRNEATTRRLKKEKKLFPFHE
jgi:hypothetical protein